MYAVEPSGSDDSDEDYTAGPGNVSRGTDEDEEYRDDRTVQISMKELLDLFEDEYFVRGRSISVDRLRKRLEMLDNEKSSKLGFDCELVHTLDQQICQVSLSCGIHVP